MNTLNPEKEIKNILSILDTDSGLRLREIHERLEDMEGSSFDHSPPRGEGYNDERYLLKGLIEFLSVKKEYISADGTRWSLTVKGRAEVQ